MLRRISNTLIGYENKWVALTLDRKKVVDADKDFKKLQMRLKKNKKENVVVHFVLPFDRIYSF